MGNRLFVYGIFLGEAMRKSYGMFNPKYTTVKGYKTVDVTGDGFIVQAVASENSDVLSGLIVDVMPVTEDVWGSQRDTWERLDALEGAYDRIEVVTTDLQEAWMYIKKKG